MTKYIIILSALLNSIISCAQKPSSEKELPVPCDGSADMLPGKYYDHTQPKYPSSLKTSSAQEKTLMLNQLIAFEKLEEKSRSNFSNTGCVLRTSFSSLTSSTIMGYAHTAYGYQLAAYQNVCHATQHIVKTVDEYRTVFRINVNPTLIEGSYYGEGGDFYITDKSVRYEVAIDAKRGATYDKDRITNRSHIAQYVSEAMVLTNRSDNYKNKHGDFLKIINGEDYVENYLNGSRDDKPNPKSYKWIDRHYLITKPGVPLLIPVSRKQYLEALLEYYEIEKANFQFMVTLKINDDVKNTSDAAKKRMSIYEADKVAYSKIYESKKMKVAQLLNTQKEDWLQQPAVVLSDRSPRPNDYQKASNGLFDFDKFYDGNEKSTLLYQHNIEYFKTSVEQPAKPIFLEVQFRYELAEDRGFSERLFTNFLKNYDMDALHKMIE